MTVQITGNAKEIAALIKELQGQKNANNNTQDIEQFAKELKEGLSQSSKFKTPIFSKRATIESVATFVAISTILVLEIVVCSDC